MNGDVTTDSLSGLTTSAHLWWTASDAPGVSSRSGDYLALLSPEERERWEGIRVERGRQEFLLGRALLRTTLSRYVAREPDSWRFTAGQRGKPELTEEQVSASPELAELRFNLAHAEGLVVCVVTRGGEAGVDVEHPDRAVDTPALAQRFFSPTEQAAVAEVRHAQRAEAFFAIWTLKEAYLKARGVGIGLPLRSLSFAPTMPFSREGEVAIQPHFGEEVGDDPELWQLDLFRAPTGHLIATALTAPALTAEASERRTILHRPALPLADDPQAPGLEHLAAS